jgi:hypothetical protein
MDEFGRWTMRTFVKIKDEFNGAIWVEMLCNDMKGDVVVLRGESVERIRPEEVISQYIDHDEPDYPRAG